MPLRLAPPVYSIRTAKPNCLLSMITLNTYHMIPSAAEQTTISGSLFTFITRSVCLFILAKAKCGFACFYGGLCRAALVDLHISMLFPQPLHRP